MKITKYYDGIRGEYIEFQVVTLPRPHDQSEWLKIISHWDKDSLFLRHTPDIPYPIFDAGLGDGWWLSVNQIDYKETMKLVKTLQDAQVVEDLTTWILSRIQEDTYLNILGV